MSTAPDAMTASSPVLPYPKASRGAYVVFILMICWTFSFVDRAILSIIVDPVRQDLQLSEVQVGFVMGPAFAAFYIFFGLLMGHIADVRSRRNLIAFGVLAWSAATVACGLAVDFWSLSIARMLVGAGEAALGPAAYSLIPDYIRPKRIGTALAVFSCGITLGGGLALAGGGYIVEFASQSGLQGTILSGMAGWRVALLAFGIPGILVAGLLVLTVKEPVRRQAGKHLVPMSEFGRYLRSHARLMSMASLGIAVAAVVPTTWVFWGPTFYIRAHGLSPQQAGLYFGFIQGVLSTIAALSGGYVRDLFVGRGNFEAPLLVVMGAMLLSTPMLVISILMDYNLLSLSLFAVGAGISAAIAGMHGAAVIALFPGYLRGRASAIHIMIVSLVGMMVAPLFTAVLTEHVFRDDLQIGKSLAATCAAAGALSVLMLAICLKPAHQHARRIAEEAGEV